MSNGKISTITNEDGTVVENSNSGLRYLVVVYVVTAGLHGDDLGSDEEEIVHFAWLVLDVQTNKVSVIYLGPRPLPWAHLVT